MRPARLAVALHSYKGGMKAVQVWVESERRQLLQVYRPDPLARTGALVWSAPVLMEAFQMTMRALALLERVVARVYGLTELRDGLRSFADPEFAKFKKKVLEDSGWTFEGRIGSPDNWQENWHKGLGPPR